MRNLRKKAESLAQGHAVRDPVLDCSLYKYISPILSTRSLAWFHQLIPLPVCLTILIFPGLIITGIICLFFTSLTDTMQHLSGDLLCISLYYWGWTSFHRLAPQASSVNCLLVSSAHFSTEEIFLPDLQKFLVCSFKKIFLKDLLWEGGVFSRLNETIHLFLLQF